MRCGMPAPLPSYSQDDVVDGDEHQLDDVADEPNHHEAHGASLQDLHILYTNGKHSTL